MKYKRFNLSEFMKLRDEDHISGNFTSVRGEYYIPYLNKTGFYKVNGCMDNAKNDEDLRELFASHILDEIGFPHADIVPIFDDTHNCNGCLSLNILKNGETFAISQSIPHEKSFSHVGEFISHDLKEVSSLPGITEKDLKERKNFLARYLYVSAILQNTDIRSDNRCMIYNPQNHTYRIPEYYDAGISFSSDPDFSAFISDMSSADLLKELYEDYAVEIFPLAQKVEYSLTPEKINELLEPYIFSGFSPDTKKQIICELNDRISLSKQYNHNILTYGRVEPYTISMEDIEKRTKGISVSMKDSVKNYILSLREKFFGKGERD